MGEKTPSPLEGEGWGGGRSRIAASQKGDTYFCALTMAK
jgi:hypothetical protein